MSNLQAIFLYQEHKFLKNPDLINNIAKGDVGLQKMCKDAVVAAKGACGGPNLSLALVNIEMHQRHQRKRVEEALHRGIAIDSGYITAVRAGTSIEDAVAHLALTAGCIKKMASITGFELDKFIAIIVPFDYSCGGTIDKLADALGCYESVTPIYTAVTNANSNLVAVAPTAYTNAMLAKLWIENGGAPEEAEMMAAIAMAESSGRPDIINRVNANGTWDIGLWQINTVHQGAFGLPTCDKPPVEGPLTEHLRDPANNARAAVKIRAAQGFKAWVSYKTGAYMKYM